MYQFKYIVNYTSVYIEDIHKCIGRIDDIFHSTTYMGSLEMLSVHFTDTATQLDSVLDTSQSTQSTDFLRGRFGGGREVFYLYGMYLSIVYYSTIGHLANLNISVIWLLNKTAASY